jgi:transposase
MELVVGWDWADTHHDVVVEDRPGHRVWAGTVDHSREALELLEGRLVTWAQGVRADVRVVIETSQALVVDWLSTTGFTVYPVNPKVADARRKPSGAKTDRLDAAILARLGWHEADTLRPLRPADEAWVELRQLTQVDAALTVEHTRLVNQLMAALKSYYPVVLTLFDDLSRPTALAFLAQWADPRDSRALSVSQLTRWLRQHRYPHAEAAAARMHAQLQAPALEATPGKARALIRWVRALVAQLQALEAHRVDIREQIDALFTAHADHDLWASVPGVGPLLGARLVAAFGADRDRFASAEAVQALAGTSPVAYQSGKLRRVHLRRACDKHFRQTMHQLAFSSLTRCSWARAYYDAYRARGHGHHAALRALANVWLRILFRMWQDRAPYDEARFAAARARRHVA